MAVSSRSLRPREVASPDSEVGAYENCIGGRTGWMKIRPFKNEAKLILSAILMEDVYVSDEGDSFLFYKRMFPLNRLYHLL